MYENPWRALASIHTTLSDVEGITFTPEFERLLALDEYLRDLAANTRRTTREAVAEALRTPGTTPEAFGNVVAVAAAADSAEGSIATLALELRNELLTGLREEFAKTAEGNYTAIARRFNTAAQALTAAAETVDVTVTDPAVALTWTKRAQEAWMGLPALTATLDTIGDQLLDFAEAAGVNLNAARLHPDHSDRWLPLTIDPTGHHRRRVWEAWDNTNRWVTLTLAGIPIHARELAHVEPYARPADLIERRVPKDEGGIRGHVIEYTDPEDPDYQPTPDNGFRRVTV